MAEKSRTSRLASYKNACQGTTELRRKRVELSVSLRKQARDDQLSKRRAMSPDPEDTVQEPEPTMTPAQIVEGLKSTNAATQLLAARAARRILSKDQNPPIVHVVEAGAVKPLVAALDRYDCQELQFEAAWALTNIASGTHENTMAVVNGGAVPKLVVLLGEGGVVGEQAAWALGNIAGDGAGLRDVVLSNGALAALQPYFKKESRIGLLRTVVWTYSNFCRNKNPLVQFDLVAPTLPYIADLLQLNDMDVLADLCWALSYLSDGPNERIEEVQKIPNLLPRLIALLKHKSHAVTTPALRAIGNMLTGSDEQTDRCIQAGCVECLGALLRSGRPTLMKEAAWAVSNILAGTKEQIQVVIDNGLLVALVEVLSVEDIKCQKEAAWAITNLCQGGSAEQLDALVGVNFLEPYCALLDAPDQRAIVVVLDGITTFLEAATRFGQGEALCIRLEEIGALDRIEALQEHENENIYKKCVHILDTYFAEQDDKSAQPLDNGDEFQFGTNPTTNLNF